MARYRRPFSTIAALAAEVGPDAYRQICWREGSKGQLSSRFAAIRVKLTNVRLRSAYADRELPIRWLLAEWPAGKDAPTDFWISDLPDHTPLEDLVALAKAQGCEAAGPVERVADLPAALDTALRAVAAGSSYLLDVRVVPGYAAPLLTRATPQGSSEASS